MSAIDAGRDITVANRTSLSEQEASSLAERLFGIKGRGQHLDGE